MAIQMFTYRAAEAGIRCDVIEDNDLDIASGAELVQVGKRARRMERQIKRESASVAIHRLAGIARE
jgi:hypothetical protein